VSHPRQNRPHPVIRKGRYARWALELATTFRVLALFVLVEVLIRPVSLTRLIGLLGCKLSLDPPLPETALAPPTVLSTAAKRQMRCTRRVARHWPFAQGPCLRSALVGAHLLRRLDPTIRIGTVGTDAALSAHAWIEVRHRPLEQTERFQPFQARVEGCP
jgi:hypothetical protein